MSVKEPWTGRVEPFRIFGNLYFAGTIPASCHLIDTGDGLILIDTGYPQNFYLVIESIWELGFRPADIRYIVHSHGHYDHMGATRSLVELTGAKTFIGAADKDFVTWDNPLNWANKLGYEFTETFEPDVLLNDGDVISLGNTSIRCVSTPGHTPGTTSFFFDVEENGRKLRAGMHGGVGMNSLSATFLKEANLPLTLQQDFLDGLERLRKEHVDIFIGNHVKNNDTVGKGAALKLTRENNPFIDENAWPIFLDQCRQKMLDCIAKG